MKLISVIDDDRVFCKLIEQHLQALGYETSIYHSGRDFFSAQKTKPYAIILDHYLNERDTGLDYLKQLKKEMPGVPIIYLTVLTKEKLPANLAAMGIHTYIGKDSASLVRLRTILDNLEGEKKNWWQRLFSKP
jgi:DNA-binding response OmpR family regulator